MTEVFGKLELCYRNENTGSLSLYHADYSPRSGDDRDKIVDDITSDVKTFHSNRVSPLTVVYAQAMVFGYDRENNKEKLLEVVEISID